MQILVIVRRDPRYLLQECDAVSVKRVKIQVQHQVKMEEFSFLNYPGPKIRNLETERPLREMTLAKVSGGEGKLIMIGLI